MNRKKADVTVYVTTVRRRSITPSTSNAIQNKKAEKDVNEKGTQIGERIRVLRIRARCHKTIKQSETALFWEGTTLEMSRRIS